MKTSYSQNNVYKKCPQHWHWKYEKRLTSPIEGASLYFGSAVDSAIMSMLENKPHYVESFKNHWYSAYQWGKKTPIFDNDNITYSHNDFDEHVLDKADATLLLTWAKELGTDKLAKSGVEIYKKVAGIKKNPYKKITHNQLRFFNRASWLSLKRKGVILINVFKEQFFPKITKVHANQLSANLTDPSSGDSIRGYLDMVLEIEGYDKPIIFDLKTSANPYRQEQLEHSDQLTLYAAMKGKEYDTNLVGYAVLSKNIPKDTVATCSKCGFTKNSKHRTCNNEVGGKRCGSKWDESIALRPEVQVMVKEKTQEDIASVLNDAGTIVHAMKTGIVYKNTEFCRSWYGSTCPYYGACHENDLTGLIKK